MTVTLTGTGGADVLTALTSEGHLLLGLGGNDTLKGSGGIDTLIGGTGNDRLDGGAGDDVFLVTGNEGNDTYIGGTGLDTILGGAGNDVINAFGTATFSGIEAIDGGGGFDAVRGGTSADTIDLRAMTIVNLERVEGGAGNDKLHGSAGADTLAGGAGTDTHDGGAGDDVFLATGSEGNDSFFGGAGNDTILGGAGDDVIGLIGASSLSSVERIDGGAGFDVVRGSSSADTIDLRATVLADLEQVEGGAGNDKIFGTAGSDTLIGGAGDDTLDGAGGSDVVLYANPFASYVVTAGGTSTSVKGTAVGDGTDKLISVETIRFTDGDFVGGVFVPDNDPTNTAPLAQPDAGGGDEDTTQLFDVLGNDSDPDGDALTVTEATGAAHGTLTVNPGGTITYLPHLNFFGADGFDYTIADGRGGTSSAHVDVTVDPVNDAPDAKNDAVGTLADTPVDIAVLGNDTDVDGDALTVTGATNGANGTTTVNPDGTVTYLPNAGFSGLDSFAYSIGDGAGAGDAATVSVNVGTGEPPPSSLFLETLLDVPENGWVSLNVNEFRDAFPPAGLRPTSLGNPAAIMRAWSSTAWDPNDETLIAWGGGHANYSGNDVYVFDTATLRWTRGSLSSQIKSTGDSHYIAVDGVDAAPISSHTYDNTDFLPLADRMITFGGSSYQKDGFMDATHTLRTGPYLWDPNLADPNKVGGTTGSHINPALNPGIVGGEMWENRDHWGGLGAGEPAAGKVASGTTAYAFENGTEVVYVSEQPAAGGKLYRYVINDAADASQDEWQLVGTGYNAYAGQGAGAYDPENHVYVRTHQGGFTFWDTTKSGTTNKNVLFNPSDPGNTFDISVNMGMDFDPVRGDFVLWNGVGGVWRLSEPDTLGASGWVITKEVNPVPSLAPPSGSVGTGVLGKWDYVPDYDVFIGVMGGGSLSDPNLGDVWAWKPTDWSPTVEGYSAVAAADPGTTVAPEVPV